MDYRNLIGLAAIICACGYFILSLQPAIASMPVGMQHGQFPFEHFTDCDIVGAGASTYDGCTPPTGVHSLLTTPSDRVFIITGAVTAYSYACYLEINGQPISTYAFFEGSQNRSNASSPFIFGNAHYQVPAGTSLDINISTSSCRYYVEGYYAHP
jgi:hypothetical protein